MGGRMEIGLTDGEMDAAFAARRAALQRGVGPTEMREDMRLCLQVVRDAGGACNGMIMWLSDCLTPVVELGWLEVTADRGLCEHRLTAAGSAALDAANAALGDKATRYAYGSLGGRVFGYPRLVPLTTRVVREGDVMRIPAPGEVAAPKKGFWRRILGN